MGTLIGMSIPLSINILGKLADHNYVKCGTGKKTWKCWGRNDGGANIATGTASTIQANKIAIQNNKASNESAGLQYSIDKSLSNIGSIETSRTFLRDGA